MSQVRDLAGKHLGKTITITTDNTTATGTLQGIQHVSDVISDPRFDGSCGWMRGKTATAITLLPDQTIVAELGDTVIIEGEA